jgi:TfoX/Sxy family transcriptional regulator of competence genes
MAYDEALAARVRARIGDHPALTEREMFGGIAFMIGGNMAVGVHGTDLMVRVGKAGHDAAVARPGARIMDFTAHPMVGWITVTPEGFTQDAHLDAWVDLGVTYAGSLPAK